MVLCACCDLLISTLCNFRIKYVLEVNCRVQGHQKTTTEEEILYFNILLSWQDPESGNKPLSSFSLTLIWLICAINWKKSNPTLARWVENSGVELDSAKHRASLLKLRHVALQRKVHRALLQSVLSQQYLNINPSILACKNPFCFIWLALLINHYRNHRWNYLGMYWANTIRAPLLKTTTFKHPKCPTVK